MNGSKYPQLNDRDWLWQRAVVEDLNAVQIARLVGCGREAVMRALERFEIPAKPRGARSGPAQLKDPVWLREQIKTKTIREIAEELGCAPSSVLTALRRFQIPVPGRKTRRPSPTRSESIKRTLREKYGPEGRTGPKAGNWKGGVQTYDYVWLHREVVKQRWPNHPRLALEGWSRCQEHILVWEAHEDRLKPPGCEIDHKNRDKHDNRFENLELKGSRGEAQRDEWAKYDVQKERADTQEERAEKYRQMLLDAGIDPDQSEAA